MSDMLNINPNWKYYLNLASQAFPLKTNAQLVKILKTYNGSNDIESSMAVNHDRFVFLPEFIRIVQSGISHVHIQPNKYNKTWNRLD